MFAASVVHDLRTPLAALSGEVELALARERTSTAYREALARIGDQLAQLVDWTSDLAILGARPPSPGTPERRASLAAVLAQLGERYRNAERGAVRIETDASEEPVAGSETLLTRALTLLIDQGLKYRANGGQVRLRTLREGERGLTGLLLDVVPPKFPGLTWYHVAADGGDPDSPQAPGFLRLRTAVRMLEDCGGSLTVRCTENSDAVEIRLPCPQARLEDLR